MLDKRPMSKPSRNLPIRAARRLAPSVCALAAALAFQLAASPTAFAAPTTADTRPYDERLMRLAELLGAVHYLRELCGANDGQLWRERMRDLIQAEGSSALRRARLTRGFNQGYRSYSRTYSACTPSAKTAIERFLTEGAEITDALVKSNP
jgi:uncharacterized protein (TIGR02301 family)